MSYWREFKVGDLVVYTGKYINLSWDLTGKIGTIIKITHSPEEAHLGRPQEDTVIDVLFNFGHKQDDRSVFAANCELVKRSKPTWEL